MRKAKPDGWRVGACGLLLVLCISRVAAERPEGAVAGPFVAIETRGGGESAVVAGDAGLADRPMSPASTFKIVLAWAGIEEGLLVPGTRHHCSDAPPPGGPREINLQEAMRHSSNAYFCWVAERLGMARMTAYANRSGLAAGPIAGDWVGGDMLAAVRGGRIEVTARRLHAFTARVMRGGLTSGPGAQAALEAAMAWPSADSGVSVFGKTGAWGGASWYTGFFDRGGARTAVTVLVPYMVPEWRAARERAIGIFYGRAGLPPP